MHRMYKKWFTEKGTETHKSYDFYLKTFQTRLNLKMHKPKKMYAIPALAMKTHFHKQEVKKKSKKIQSTIKKSWQKGERCCSGSF